MTLWHTTCTRATLLSSLGAFVGNRALAQISATGLTIDQEEHLGSIMWEKWKAERGIAETPQSSRVERYLQSVCDKLAPNVPHKMKFHAHLDADALAVVIGHEMAHIENGDIDADLAGLERTKHTAPLHLADLPVDSVTPNHTNAQELAADRVGLTFAAAAGYSPYVGVRLLELFQYMARGKSPRPGTLTLEQRLSQMRRLLASNDWQSLKNRVHPLALPEPT